MREGWARGSLRGKSVTLRQQRFHVTLVWQCCFLLVNGARILANVFISLLVCAKDRIYAIASRTSPSRHSFPSQSLCLSLTYIQLSSCNLALLPSPIYTCCHVRLPPFPGLSAGLGRSAPLTLAAMEPVASSNDGKRKHVTTACVPCRESKVKVRPSVIFFPRPGPVRIDTNADRPVQWRNAHMF